MSTESATIAAETPTSYTDFTLIDCDVHPYFKDGLNSLVPYMSSSWARKLGLNRGGGTWAGLPNTGAFGIPTNSIYTSLDGSYRMEAMPADGSPPASSVQQLQDLLLDPLGIDRAILLQGNVFGLGCIPNAEIAKTIAHATNDWLWDEWASVDTRLRSSVVVAPQDPVAAAAEIRRNAERGGAVQVYMPQNQRLMGDPFFYPIYEAAQECGFPVAVHPTAVESIHVNGPQIAGEPPWYYIEWRATLTLPQQANAASLVAHGVFERFPDLHIVFTEVGMAWLAELMWRMDKDWKGLRDETPWLTRLPSEYMLDHFRFTTQPFPEPRKREHLLAIFDIIDASRTLMFSTDFPHWDGDDPRFALRPLPEDLQERLRCKTAIELYGDLLA